MREVKFRAYNTNKKVMYSAEELGQDELTINPDGRGFVNVSGTSIRLSQYMEHLIPLQYTGLKDKNGKEIYEGDIVLRDKFNNHEQMEVIVEDIRQIPRQLFGSEINWIEIVGNI